MCGGRRRIAALHALGQEKTPRQAPEAASLEQARNPIGVSHAPLILVVAPSEIQAVAGLTGTVPFDIEGARISP